MTASVVWLAGRPIEDHFALVVGRLPVRLIIVLESLGNPRAAEKRVPAHEGCGCIAAGSHDLGQCDETLVELLTVVLDPMLHRVQRREH